MPTADYDPLEARDIPREATHVRDPAKSEAFDEVCAAYAEVCAAYAEVLRELARARKALAAVVVPLGQTEAFMAVTDAKQSIDRFLDPRRTHDALARGRLLLTRGDAVEELRAENARLRAVLENRS